MDFEFVHHVSHDAVTQSKSAFDDADFACDVAAELEPICLSFFKARITSNPLIVA